MIRGTTPTFTLTVGDSELDLSQASNVYVTVTQGNKRVTKTGSALTISGNVVSCYLSQTETLAFKAGQAAEIQVNWIYTEGSATKRAATDPKQIIVGFQLLPEVLPSV